MVFCGRGFLPICNSILIPNVMIFNDLSVFIPFLSVNMCDVLMELSSLLDFLCIYLFTYEYIPNEAIEEK